MALVVDLLCFAIRPAGRPERQICLSRCRSTHQLSGCRQASGECHDFEPRRATPATRFPERWLVGQRRPQLMPVTLGFAGRSVEHPNGSGTSRPSARCTNQIPGGGPFRCSPHPSSRRSVRAPRAARLNHAQAKRRMIPASASPSSGVGLVIGNSCSFRPQPVMDGLFLDARFAF